ncbi:uncharacterized protein LOC116344467 [Contarinia nasturtii]|uniref:uncharacterized protein LOC116344467 n=1 Tax=Contarinia nasturtii TaxID=265458 RepID=UPI0012D42573|nr:uncharacterized protein LOC116344467 [Contarinia nasturtii]
MRRASFTPAFKISVDEPLIVVDESEELENEGNEPTSPKSIEEDVDDDKDSPDNPYLLSPFRDPRDTRKHSLPNIQCTSGIMASQVRRLSDGGENAPTASEMAFLAKLSQASTSSGRRHSVVTISRVPQTLFGRNRRESFAAIASSGENDALNARLAKHRGSVHNLQLDIMDGIVQVGKI